MSKTRGIDSNGDQTIKFQGNGNIYEIRIVSGDFALFTNNELTLNLGTLNTNITTNTAGVATNLASIALKANAASPVFTGTTTMALAIYANDTAAKADGLTVGQLYQVTSTGVVQVVLA